MREREIGPRRHFDQARGGALELGRLDSLARAVEPGGFGVGAGDELDRVVADYLAVRGYFPTRAFTAPRFVLFSSRASTGGGPYLVEDAYALASG